MDERENIREDSPAEEGIGKTGRGKKILLAAVIFIAAKIGRASCRERVLRLV